MTITRSLNKGSKPDKDIKQRQAEHPSCCFFRSEVTCSFSYSYFQTFSQNSHTQCFFKCSLKLILANCHMLPGGRVSLQLAPPLGCTPLQILHSVAQLIQVSEQSIAGYSLQEATLVRPCL